MSINISDVLKMEEWKECRWCGIKKVDSLFSRIS